MTVREAMGSQFVTVRDTESVLAGLKRLVKEGISGAPVISADSQLMGMVTEFDLLLAIDHVGEEFPISRVMHKDVVSIPPDATLDQARNLILKHNYRRLPVVENDKVIGVLSRRDLLRVRFGL
jgi:CBS domain-containing protein